MLFAEEADGNLVPSVRASSTQTRDFFCPNCRKHISYVKQHERTYETGTTTVVSHFRHRSESQSDCDYPEDAEHSPESDVHTRMIIVGLDRLKGLCSNGESETPRFPAYAATDFDDEVWLNGSRTKQIGGHYLDAYIDFSEEDPKYGKGIILEAQYEGSKKPVKPTTHDYHDAGYSVVWAYERHYGDSHTVNLPDPLASSDDFPFKDDYRNAIDDGSLWRGTEIDRLFGDSGFDSELLDSLPESPDPSTATLLFDWNWEWYDQTHGAVSSQSNTPRSTSTPMSTSTTSGQSSSGPPISKLKDGQWPLRSSRDSKSPDCEGCNRVGAYHVSSKSSRYDYDLRLCKPCVDRTIDLIEQLKKKYRYEPETISAGLKHVPHFTRHEDCSFHDRILNEIPDSWWMNDTYPIDTSRLIRRDSDPTSCIGCDRNADRRIRSEAHDFNFPVCSLCNDRVYSFVIDVKDYHGDDVKSIKNAISYARRVAKREEDKLPLTPKYFQKHALACRV
jgi:hypothetical protein